MDQGTCNIGSVLNCHGIENHAISIAVLKSLALMSWSFIISLGLDLCYKVPIKRQACRHCPFKSSLTQENWGTGANNQLDRSSLNPDSP